MTFKISDFKSQIDRLGGPMRQSLFEVQIVNFPVNTSSVTTRDLSFFCKNVAIPGITMGLNSYEAVGQQRRMYPTSLNPEPVQAIFMLDSNHQILSFFHSWAQRVVNYSTYCNWIEDNNLTPYVLVRAKSKGLSIPDRFENNGKIVLNISASATADRLINNEIISFKARFNGKSQKIIVPCEAVMSIYANENGEGMLFDNKGISSDKGDKKPSLTILD